VSTSEPLVELYSVDDLARLFGVTKQTVFRWNSGGIGPRRILVGRRIYYRSADVREWLNGREAK
jgi:predicted DNA-binding transcriptional regulator AlpA